MDLFSGAVDAFASALVQHMQRTGSAEQVIRAQARSVGFMGDLRDLGTLCRALQAGSIDQAVKDAAARVLEHLTPGGYVVAEGHRGPTVEGCLGVTLYFPKPLAPVSQFYRDLRFAQRGWDEFLDSYQRAVRGD